MAATQHTDVEDHAWRMYRELGGDMSSCPTISSRPEMSAATTSP